MINEFTTNKLFLIGISCGFAPIGVLIENESSLSFDYHIAKEKDHFVHLQRLETPVLNQYYSGEFLSRKDFFALAIGKSIFEKLASFECFYREETYSEFKEYSKFKKIGIVSLSFIFLLVVFNYFYLGSLNNRIAEKEAEIALNNSNLSLLERLNQEEIRKKQLAMNSNTNTTYFISYYLDEIGKSVPNKIRLSEMYVFPLSQKLKEKRKVELDKTRIEISGWTNDNIILDDWIEKLDRQDWIKSVELIHYHKSNDEAEFKVIIFLP